MIALLLLAVLIVAGIVGVAGTLVTVLRDGYHAVRTDWTRLP